MLIIQPLILIGLPAITHIRRMQPAWLFAIAALAYTLLATIQLSQRTQIRLLSSTSGGSFHDTYYVISDGAYAAGLAAFFAVLFVLHLGQSRFLTVPAPRLLTGLFWTLHLSLLAVSSVPNWVGHFGMPRRYVDYPDHIARINLITTCSGAISLVALTGIIALLALSIWRRNGA